MIPYTKPQFFFNLQTDQEFISDGVTAFDTEVTLVVTVGNQGPSTIQDATLEIFFPSRLESVTGDFTFLYPYDIVSDGHLCVSEINLNKHTPVCTHCGSVLPYLRQFCFLPYMYMYMCMCTVPDNI